MLGALAPCQLPAVPWAGGVRPSVGTTVWAEDTADKGPYWMACEHVQVQGDLVTDRFRLTGNTHREAIPLAGRWATAVETQARRIQKKPRDERRLSTSPGHEGRNHDRNSGASSRTRAEAIRAVLGALAGNAHHGQKEREWADA
jgi:hypothetical protein